MELDEAIRLLGVRAGDGMDKLRQRYHEEMHRCHPDVCGDEKGKVRAQQVNEAYALIKRSWPLPGQTALGGKWSEKVNERAYARRRVRMQDAPFGEVIVLDVAEGRYLWEPQLAPFTLFLQSLGELASDLAAEAQADERTKGRILHLLLQEYIQPLVVLEDLEEMGRIERTGVTWRIGCQVETGAYDPREVPEGYAVKIQSLRTYGVGPEGELLGQISFSEDAMYYVITPLIEQGNAEGRLFLKPEKVPAKGTRRKSRGSLAHREGYLLLTFTDKPWEDPTEKINRELDGIVQGKW